MTAFTKRFANCSLDNFATNDEEQTKMIEYLKSCLTNGFSENIVITGGVGLGKTHLAYSIVNALEKKMTSPTGWEFYTKKSVDLVNIKYIIDNIKNLWKDKADGYDKNIVAEFKKIGVLIIDEVGVQYGTDSERLELFEIFNARYNAMLPTIIISNHTLEELPRILGLRIIDRLFSGAKFFELKGKSKR